MHADFRKCASHAIRYFIVFLWHESKAMKSNIKRYVLSLVLLIAMAMNAPAKDFVVVIDAGHGGKDVGAVGAYALEKDINLGVALKLGEEIKSTYDDVRVVYTRDDDTFVSLQGRANIADREKGDLFISIHTNSLDKRSRNRLTVSGAETYTLGLHRTKENLDVAMRENSVIELEDDYSATYQGFDPNSVESYIIFELNQSKHMEQSVNFASLVQQEFSAIGRVDKGVRQAGFWVLAATIMPAVLVELDFICNPTQEDFLASESGQKKMAGAIFKAFRQYKEEYDYYSSGTEDSAVVVGSPESNENRREREGISAEEVEYRVQFLSSGERLDKKSRFFRGLKDVDCYYEDGVYKYTTGSTTNKADAQKQLKKVRKLFADAFLVQFKNGKRIK